MNNNKSNKYCSLSSLRSKSDVESLLVEPLLADLGYRSSQVEKKTSILEAIIGSDADKKSYAPDYQTYLSGAWVKPALIIDVRNPDQCVESGLRDAQIYASVTTKGAETLDNKKICLSINGHILIAKYFDSGQILHSLTFDDFINGNLKFQELKRELARENLAEKSKKAEQKKRRLHRESLYPPFPNSVEKEAQLNFDISEPNPYVHHEKLVRLAQRNPPKTISPTVSSFTGWIYDLYIPVRDEKSIHQGSEFERSFKKDLLDSRAQARHGNCRIQPKLLPQWEVIYEDPLDKPYELFSISSLTVNGTPLSGRPDMVYRQQGSGNVLIVEHKSFWKEGKVPTYGWPNLKAQLWCYGMIDQWKDAPQVFLMGRVFDMNSYLRDRKKYIREYSHSIADVVCDIGSYIFNTKIICANDPRVNRECAQLFTLYGGQYSALKS